jgi:hypothetical protein
LYDPAYQEGPRRLGISSGGVTTKGSFGSFRNEGTMIRRLLLGVAAIVSATLVASGMATVAASAAASPISLVVPQSTAFGVLGYDCGDIREQAYTNGFDPTSGYPTGDVYLSTTCSAGGKGGHSVTYTAWVSTEWDFTGALVTLSKLTTAPTVDPTFSAFDAHGNEIKNSPPFAYLVLASGFVPAPRVAGVSPATAPQGTTVTIIGTGFTGATVVAFGTVASKNFVLNSDTSITAVAPAVKSGTVDVRVTGPGGTSAVNLSDRFMFNLLPRVGAISPNHGTTDGGTKVTITGANLTHATTVAFGGVPAKFSVNKNALIAVSPPGSDSGVSVDVTVTNAYGTSALSPVDVYLYQG